jgi:large conductance mechanosensitive channel
MGLVQEFKDFALKGNVVDMAVGIIIGGAFGKIVSSLVGDVIMPVVGNLTGGVNFTDLQYTLGTKITEVEKAGQMVKESTAVYLKYGNFIQTCVDFFIIALAIFVMVKIMNRVREQMEGKKEVAAAAPPEDIVLLREIRDALKKK